MMTDDDSLCTGAVGRQVVTTQLYVSVVEVFIAAMHVTQLLPVCVLALSVSHIV